MLREHVFESFDGTRLTYRVYGADAEAPWLVICNGYGGTFSAWAEVMPLLVPHLRVLIWDYRGQHKSETPRDRRLLRIADNVRDLDRLLAAEGIDRFVLAGWSVGVQVALEAYRRHPSRVLGIALLNGAHERVLRNVLAGRLGPLGRPIAQIASRVMGRALPPARPALKRFARSRLAPSLAERLGMITGRPATFPEAFSALLDLDWQVYLGMAVLADDHRTEDWLPEVKAPVLITAGARDALTPPSIARRAAARLPDAEYVEFPRGTHYTLMEFPDQVAAHLLRFTRRVIDATP